MKDTSALQKPASSGSRINLEAEATWLTRDFCGNKYLTIRILDTSGQKPVTEYWGIKLQPHGEGTSIRLPQFADSVVATPKSSGQAPEKEE